MASASDDKKLGEKDDAPHPLLPKNHSAELCAFTWKNLKHKHDFESKKLHDQRKELCKLKNDKKQLALKKQQVLEKKQLCQTALAQLEKRAVETKERAQKAKQRVRKLRDARTRRSITMDDADVDLTIARVEKKTLDKVNYDFIVENSELSSKIKKSFEELVSLREQDHKKMKEDIENIYQLEYELDAKRDKLDREAQWLNEQMLLNEQQRKEMEDWPVQKVLQAREINRLRELNRVERQKFSHLKERTDIENQLANSVANNEELYRQLHNSNLQNIELQNKLRN